MKQITIFPNGYGHFEIKTFIRGKQYRATTTNTLAVDRYKDDETGNTRGKFYNSQNQAAAALYNEIKRANNL